MYFNYLQPYPVRDKHLEAFWVITSIRWFWARLLKSSLPALPVTYLYLFVLTFVISSLYMCIISSFVGWHGLFVLWSVKCWHLFHPLSPTNPFYKLLILFFSPKMVFAPFSTCSKHSWHSSVPSLNVIFSRKPILIFSKVIFLWPSLAVHLYLNYNFILSIFRCMSMRRL